MTPVNTLAKTLLMQVFLNHLSLPPITEHFNSVEAGAGPIAILPPKSPKRPPSPMAPRIPRRQSESCSNSSAVNFIVNKRNFSLDKTSSTVHAVIKDAI